MNLRRVLSMLVILSFWLSGGNPIAPLSAVIASPTGLGLAAISNFTKSAPVNGANIDSPASVTLSWHADVTSGNYTWSYCLQTKSANCSKTNPRWVQMGALTPDASGNYQFVVTGLLPNVTYSWQVRAMTKSGGNKTYIYADGLQSTYATFVTGPLAIDKLFPLNQAVNQSPTGLSLKWNASLTPGVSYNYCLVATQPASSACPTSWVSAGAATSVPLPALNSGTTYYWQVQIVSAGGHTTLANGGWWSFRTANSPDYFGKIYPGLNETAVPIAGLTLSWNGTNATRYEYCLSQSPYTCTGAWESTGTATRATLAASLTYDVDYYWQVRAFNFGGVTYADQGAWWAFHTQVAPPGSFGKVSPTDGTTNTQLAVTLRWNANPNLTYSYCFDTAANMGGVPSCTSSWLPVGPGLDWVTTSGLDPNTKYYWQVMASNASGSVEADGAWWSFTTEDIPVDALLKGSPANAAVNQPLATNLVWSSTLGTNFATYQVCLDTVAHPASVDSSCPGAGWQASLDGLSFAPTLAYNTTYYWQVRAFDGSTYVYGNQGQTPDPGWFSFATAPALPSILTQNFTVQENNTLSDVFHPSQSPKIYYYLSGNPPPGSLTIPYDGDGAFTYTPPTYFCTPSAPLTFTVAYTDEINPPQAFTVNVAVTCNSMAPVASPLQVSVLSGGAVKFNVGAFDSDVITAGDVLSYAITGHTGNVTVMPTIDPATGDFTWNTAELWASASNANNVYTFTITVTDKDTPPNSKDVVETITVQPYTMRFPLVAR